MDTFLHLLYAYLAGFGTCLVLTIGWYHGSLKPRFDALKQAAEAALAKRLGGGG